MPEDCAVPSNTPVTSERKPKNLHLARNANLREGYERWDIIDYKRVLPFEDTPLKMRLGWKKFG